MLALRASVGSTRARPWAAIVLAIAVFVARTAVAAPPAADTLPPCAAVESRLAQAESMVQSCEAARRAAEGDDARCAASLEEEKGARSRAEGETRTCTAERDTLCREADGFVRDLLHGHVTNVGTCVLSDEQRELLALLKSWENVSSQLAHLDAFAAGESDALPQAGGDTPAERLLQRLIGTKNEPLFYRRLLTEALKIVAPHAWAKMKEPAALDAWFTASEPLSPAIVEEAQRERSSGGGGTSLSVAVRLVQTYLFLAHCGEAPLSRTCARARQLAQLLDSTGPLLLRRRVEGIWATDCSDVAPSIVLAWIPGLPDDAAVDGGGRLSRGRRRRLDEAVDVLPARGARRRVLHGVAGVPPAEADRAERPDAASRRRPALGSPGRLPRGRVRTRGACATGLARLFLVRPSAVRPPSAARAVGEAAAGRREREPLGAGVREVRAAPVGGEVGGAPGELAAPALGRRDGVDRPGAPGVADRAHAPRLRPAARGAGGVRARRLAHRGHREKFGEPLSERPWRTDANGVPVEAPRFAVAERYRSWALHVVQGATSCSALGLHEARCQECAVAPAGTFFDCDQLATLDARWLHWRHLTYLVAALLSLLTMLVRWGVRLLRARRNVGRWARETRDRFAALDLPARTDPLRFLLPDRYGTLTVILPRAAAWERWGHRAAVVKTLGPSSIREADVHQAVQVAARVSSRVVFLLHDDSASLEFGAARAILDWAARGGTRTMHVLPLAVSRLSWARSADDLLDLVEESSLRGNPFEVRGRITSSSQFWNRERLVSGLLAEARAGHWLVVTGLRRFGKSSLAMEVARRLTGPSAYIDLAGFHHEVGFLADPSQAVDAVLRSVCARLVESALALYPSAALPEPPSESLDAAAFSSWMRRLLSACAPAAGGRPPPLLIVLDELEQILAVGPARLGHVLDVLSILFGRLRNAIGEAPRADAGSPIGVLLASALHPLLWAPLRTLGQQSIMGAFPSICVPCLPVEAASSMMRGLGARQGIRFSEDALALVIRESQGVPLLLRRLGTSILELYDAESSAAGGPRRRAGGRRGGPGGDRA